MKILIADSDAAYSGVLKEKLEKEKLDVDVVCDGKDVCARVKASKPDLIVMDPAFTKKDGFEVLSDIKVDAALKSIPVVVVSGMSGDQEIKRALQAGVLNYYVKDQHPIVEIVEKLKEHILLA